MMTIEFVVWKDAASIDPWTSIEDLSDQCNLIESIGFCAKDSEDSVVLCNSHDTYSGNVCCCIIIPKSCIVSRQEIKCASLPDL